MFFLGEIFFFFSSFFQRFHALFRLMNIIVLWCYLFFFFEGEREIRNLFKYVFIVNLRCKRMRRYRGEKVIENRCIWWNQGKKNFIKARFLFSPLTHPKNNHSVFSVTVPQRFVSVSALRIWSIRSLSRFSRSRHYLQIYQIIHQFHTILRFIMRLIIR